MSLLTHDKAKTTEPVDTSPEEPELTNIESADSNVNVPEERPGVKWEPKGGEIYVESFMSDDCDDILVPLTGGAASEKPKPTPTSGKTVNLNRQRAETEDLAERMLDWSLRQASTDHRGQPSFPELTDPDFKEGFVNELLTLAKEMKQHRP